MRSTPLYAPDGMAGGQFGLPGRLYEAVQAHERHDDGLVHNHAWAVSGTAAPGRRNTSHFDTASITGQKASGLAGSTEGRDWHDDGLVHNHAWAVSGK